MKRLTPVIAILLLEGCTATSPQYIAQKQAEVLANAQVTCSNKRPVDAPRNYMPCLNWAVHNSGYWGQGVKVVTASDGSPRFVDDWHSPDQPFNVAGDAAMAVAQPRQ